MPRPFQPASAALAPAAGRALAFALAVAVWISAVTAADPIEERVFPRGIPLELIGLEEGLEIIGPPPAQVFVTLSAPRSIWDRLLGEQDVITATLDLSEMSPGTETIPVDVEVNIQPSEVISYSPRSFTVTVESIISRTFSIRLIRRGEPAIGFQAETPVMSHQEVTITGPEQLVNQVQEVRAILEIDEAEAEVSRILKLQPVDANETVISGLEMSPDQITVTVDIVQRGGYRNLVVKVGVYGEIANGYRLTNISASPPTVTVFSNDPILVTDMPGYVETESLDVTGVKDDVEQRLFLDLPPGVSVVGDTFVQVLVGVTAIQSSLALSDMPVEVVGLNEGMAAEISPASVDIIISGPLPVLDELMREQVKVIVDLTNDVAFGTYQRVLHVELESSELRADSVLPESVEVTIGEAEVSLTVQDGTQVPTLEITQQATLQFTPTVTSTPVP